MRGILLIFLFYFFGEIFGENSFYCDSNLPKAETLKGYKLELVQTIIRHGDRTQLRSKGVFDSPVATWNCGLNSLNKASIGNSDKDNTKRLFRTIFKDGREFLPGNCNLGQLTDKGFNQHLALGKKLREVYEPFGIFANGTKALYFRSTNVYRTIQSGMAQITAMFPEETSANGVDVVELETRDGEMEDMVPDKICPTYKPKLDAFHKSRFWNNYHTSKKVVNLTNYLKTSFKSATYIPTFDEMFDMYNARTCHAFGVPKPITKDIAKQISDVATWELNATAMEPSLTKIGMGSFIKTLRDNLNNHVNSRNRTIRYRLFSGHDSTVGPLLGTLGIFDGFWPPYASHIELELWSKNSNYFVQLKYNGDTLTLPSCGSTLCPFQSVYKWFTSFIPTDAECHGN